MSAGHHEGGLANRWIWLKSTNPRWHHGLEMLSTLLVGESTGQGGFPSEKNPVMRFFVFSLNKLLNKQSGCGRFELPWHSCEVTVIHCDKITNINFIRILSNKHLDLWSYCSWRSSYLDSFNLKRLIALQFSSIQFKQFYRLKCIHSNK